MIKLVLFDTRLDDKPRMSTYGPTRYLYYSKTETEFFEGVLHTYGQSLLENNTLGSVRITLDKLHVYYECVKSPRLRWYDWPHVNITFSPIE